MDIDMSDEDSEDVPTSFFITASQVETQTSHDQQSILRNLPALRSAIKPKGNDKEMANQKDAIGATNIGLLESSEDEFKKQEHSRILVKDSESEYEPMIKRKQKMSKGDDKEITCLESFSDDEGGIVSPSTSDNDGNITVICRQDRKITISDISDVCVASTSGSKLGEEGGSGFQSQGFEIAPSSQKDIFHGKDDEDSDDSLGGNQSQMFKSLQLSGDSMLVPETLDQSIPDSPDIIPSTPVIIPNSPTDIESQEEQKVEDVTMYDPTAVSTLAGDDDGSSDSLPPASQSVKHKYSHSDNKQHEDKSLEDRGKQEGDSQELALQLSPSQPYMYQFNESEKRRSDSPVIQQNKMQLSETGDFQLALPGNSPLHPADKSSTYSSDTKTTEPDNVPAVPKTASLNISQMESQSENTSDTCFQLKVPHVSVTDEVMEESLEQNVFKRNPTTPVRSHPVQSMIEESSEDAFAFERKKRKTTLTGTTDDLQFKQPETEMDVGNNSEETVDSNAETQPSNEDCTEHSRMVMNENKVMEGETPTAVLTSDKSIEIVEVDQSVIVIDTQDDKSNNNEDKYTSIQEKNKDDKNVTVIVETLSDSESTIPLLQQHLDAAKERQSDVCHQPISTEAKSSQQTNQSLTKLKSGSEAQSQSDLIKNEGMVETNMPSSQDKELHVPEKRRNVSQEDLTSEKKIPRLDKDKHGTAASTSHNPDQSLSSEIPKHTNDTTNITEDPYLFHGTQSQGLALHGKSVTSIPGKVKGILATAKRHKKLSMRRLSSRRCTFSTSSSTTDGQVTKQQPVRTKKMKRDNRQTRKDMFTKPVEPLHTTATNQTDLTKNITPLKDSVKPSTATLDKGASTSFPSTGHSQKRLDLEAQKSPLQRSSNSQEDNLVYSETTVCYKIITINIKDKDGRVVLNKRKKERGDTIIVKREISREDIHQFESPTRSSSTIGSGELADIDSLSRSNSTTSKGSIPSSLEKMSPSLEILSLSVHKSASIITTNTTGNSEMAHTPNESPIGVEEAGANTEEVEVSDVLFTSPDTSDAIKRTTVRPQPPATESTSPLVCKQAADSSSQETSEIESGQRQPTDITSKHIMIEESDGFSVKGSNVSSASSIKGDVCVTPTRRGKARKTPAAKIRSKLSIRTKSNSSTTTTDSSKQSPEIPLLVGKEQIGTSSSTSYVSKLEPGSVVMAKWKDGYFYPGKIVTLETKRIRVSFDDGDLRYVKNPDVLLLNQLPIGQSVMVLSNDGYFDTGMILDCVTVSNEVQYEVEKDNGQKQRYSHSQVILSEGQAACLMSDEEIRISPHGPVGSTFIQLADVSLDNLMEGKRSRSASKNPPKEQKPSLPEPESTDVKRRGRKRKLREGGPMATSTPTPKGKKVEETDKDNQPSSSVAGVIDSPSTSSRKSSPRKFRVGLFESSNDSTTVKKTLFKGIAFILTHVTKTKEQKREEKKQLQDSSLETSTDENSADEDDSLAFNKVELSRLIKAGGGILLDKYDQDKINEYDQCFIISDSHQRTVKYLQGLSAGLPCVSHLWITFCCSQDKILDFKSYILPAGIDLEKKKIAEWNSRGSCLAGMNVMVHSSSKEFVNAWSSILSIGRCNLYTRFPTVKSNIKLDVVISDSTCTKQVKKKAEQLSVPTVSTEWVIQCLITGRIVDACGHPRYKTDFHAPK
ncbi:TP53-binding protein 1 isoform X2 [Patella vulgata]|uniref:TP53-binding protein 1 isoform X2 n=1 Tax=Patella vulgata TaxID=6465 RepID=UPI0024A9B153|nr:TP53-binding protein 1 isoform X2 [Patella vulgata]